MCKLPDGDEAFSRKDRKDKHTTINVDENKYTK